MAEETHDDESNASEESKWDELLQRCRAARSGRLARIALRASGRRASSLNRLSGAVCRFIIETQSNNDLDRDGKKEVFGLLDEAITRLERAEGNEGWAAFNGARRAGIRATPPEEIPRLAASIMAEAKSKLSGWRRTAAIDLLKKEEEQPWPSPTNLALAQVHLDERSTNVYRRLDLYAKVLFFVVTALLCALAAFYVVVEFSWLDFGPDTKLGSWRSVSAIVVLGALGSLLSVALSRVSSSEQRLPQMIEGWLIALMRPVLGAASAIALVIVLESGLQSAVEVDGNKIFVWAILAGFSERLLGRALESVADSAKSATSPTDPGNEGVAPASE